MAVEVLLPQFGMGMADGTITRWIIEDGAAVTEGEPLYELESDKSTQEVEAPATGRLRIRAQVDETHEVGTVLAIIE